MAAIPPVCDFGWKAPDFRLPASDGRTLGLGDIAGPKGTLVMFICNHCPYVLAVLDRIIRDARDLQALGVGVVAISSNDVMAYPQDGPEQMAELAKKQAGPPVAWAFFLSLAAVWRRPFHGRGVIVAAQRRPRAASNR